MSINTPSPAGYSGSIERVAPPLIPDKPLLFSEFRGSLIPIERINPKLEASMCALWTEARRVALTLGAISLIINPGKRIDRMISYQTTADGPEEFLSAPELKELSASFQKLSRELCNVSNPEDCVSLVGNRRGAPPFADAKYWEKHRIKSPYNFFEEDVFGRLIITHLPPGEDRRSAFKRTLKSMAVIDPLKKFFEKREADLEAQSKVPETPGKPTHEQIANDRLAFLQSQEMLQSQNLDLEPIYFAAAASGNKTPQNEAEELEIADRAEKAMNESLTLRVKEWPLVDFFFGKKEKKFLIGTYSSQVGDLHMSDNDRIQRRIKRKPNRDLSAPSMQQLIVGVAIHSGNEVEIRKVVKGFYGDRLTKESEDALVNALMAIDFSGVDQIDLTSDTMLTSWVKNATPFIQAHNPAPRWIRDKLPSMPKKINLMDYIPCIGRRNPPAPVNPPAAVVPPAPTN
jgi:hypothetical protein